MRILLLLLLLAAPVSAQHHTLTFTQVQIPVIILPPPPLIVLPALPAMQLFFELSPDGIRPILVLPPLIIRFEPPRYGPPARWELPPLKRKPGWALR